MSYRPRASLPVLLLMLGAALPIHAQNEAENPHGSSQPSVQEGVDYRIYDRQGRRSSILAIVDAAKSDDVLLVGEEHDDMVGHALETRLFQQVLVDIGSPTGSGRPVVLSLEMFERDVQYVLDEYLAGLISESHFLRSSRPWDDYETRYRALVEHARAFGSPVVAANAPRRYVSRVTSEGPESLLELSDLARAYLPPLPYPGPSDVYRQQWDALMTAAMLGMEDPVEDSVPAMAEHAVPPEGHVPVPEGHVPAPEGHVPVPEGHVPIPEGHVPIPEDAAPARPEMSPNAIYSQALWDASMGHAISEALVRHIGGFVVHFAGSFHVEKDTGIPERIADYRPGTRVTSIVMTKVDDIDAWSAEEHGPLGDFVVLTKKPEAPAESN